MWGIGEGGGRVLLTVSTGFLYVLFIFEWRCISCPGPCYFVISIWHCIIT